MGNGPRILAVALLWMPGCTSSPALQEFHHHGKRIHPGALHAMVGKLSDSLPTVAAVDLEGWSRSNAAFFPIEVRGDIVRARLTQEEPTLFAQYRLVGTTPGGTHLVEVASFGPGSGVFSDLLWLRFETDRVQEQDVVRARSLLKCIGRFALGDRDDGTIRLEGNHVIIGASRYRPNDVVLEVE